LYSLFGETYYKEEHTVHTVHIYIAGTLIYIDIRYIYTLPVTETLRRKRHNIYHCPREQFKSYLISLSIDGSKDVISQP